MNDKRLRKISKKELLEILLEQAKRIEELELELSETQQKLDSKMITIEEAGSIATAALELNGIFDKAQKTADQYLLNIKEKCKKIENDTKKACRLEKDNMLNETEKVCAQKKKEADEYLANAKKKAKELNKNKKSVSSKEKNEHSNLQKNKSNSDEVVDESKTKKQVQIKKISNNSKKEACEKIVID